MMGFLGGSGISWTICKQSAPRTRQTDNHSNTSSLNFYKPYALPDAQPCHSTEGKDRNISILQHIWNKPYIKKLQNDLVEGNLSRGSSCVSLPACSYCRRLLRRIIFLCSKHVQQMAIVMAAPTRIAVDTDQSFVFTRRRQCTPI